MLPASAGEEPSSVLHASLSRRRQRQGNVQTHGRGHLLSSLLAGADASVVSARQESQARARARRDHLCHPGAEPGLRPVSAAEPPRRPAVGRGGGTRVSSTRQRTRPLRLELLAGTPSGTRPARQSADALCALVSQRGGTRDLSRMGSPHPRWATAICRWMCLFTPTMPHVASWNGPCRKHGNPRAKMQSVLGRCHAAGRSGRAFSKAFPQWTACSGKHSRCVCEACRAHRVIGPEGVTEREEEGRQGYAEGHVAVHEHGKHCTTFPNTVSACPVFACAVRGPATSHRCVTRASGCWWGTCTIGCSHGGADVFQLGHHLPGGPLASCAAS